MATHITTAQAQVHAAREWPNLRPPSTIREDETIDEAARRNQRNLRARLRNLRHASTCVSDHSFPRFTPGETTTAGYIRTYFHLRNCGDWSHLALGCFEGKLQSPARWTRPAPFLTPDEDRVLVDHEDDMT